MFVCGHRVVDVYVGGCLCVLRECWRYARGWGEYVSVGGRVVVFVVFGVGWGLQVCLWGFVMVSV